MLTFNVYQLSLLKGFKLFVFITKLVPVLRWTWRKNRASVWQNLFADGYI